MEQVVRLVGADGRSGVGQVTVTTLTSGQRYASALVRGGTGLLLSGAMVVVPILHFLLVPLGLVLTGVLVFRALAVSSFIECGSGNCPYCSGTIKMFKRPEHFPFNEVCETCRRQVVVEKVS